MKDPYVLEDGTLKNLLGITDYHELNKAERDIGFIKLTNVGSKVEPSFDREFLQNLHKHIFEDIFEWAGKFRTVPIYKEELVIPGLSLDYGDYKTISKDVDQCLEQFSHVDWDSLDIDAKSQKFTQLLAKLWRVHPFRDGNTRTTMAFASLFAREHHFPLDFDVIMDSLSRKVDVNGRIVRYSIRDKFVLAALDEKYSPEPEHLQALIKHSMVSGITKQIHKLNSQLTPTPTDKKDEAER